ncbi:hypothetical protein ANN_21244 [Periplaneta americana]|uniref:Uncharacterized protein n=1 Tax=Periplaneta americana TaxID=6978 RepID=A0ABQ8SFZ6_PERAM|nr:hypothetical protein ANN_21244 [Periplaneta americana]
MLAGNEFQSLGRAIVKEDEYEEVRWDGIVSIVSWRERVFRLWWEERECGSALLDDDERDCWFQQDSATYNTSNETMQFFASFFVSVSFLKNYGPHVPPISSFGVLKARVYENRPHILEELKKNITTEINNISLRMLKKVAVNMVQSFFSTMSLNPPELNLCGFVIVNRALNTSFMEVEAFSLPEQREPIALKESLVVMFSDRNDSMNMQRRGRKLRQVSMTQHSSALE